MDMWHIKFFSEYLAPITNIETQYQKGACLMPLLAISSIVQWLLWMLNLVLLLAILRRVNNLHLPGETTNRVYIDTLRPGDVAPFFSAVTIKGVEVTSNDYSDKSIVLIFVSTSCDACRERLPEIEKELPIAQEAGIEFIYVCNDEMEIARNYFEGVNINSDVLVVPRSDNVFTREYKIPGTPYYYWINNKGIVKANDFFDSSWPSLVKQWADIGREKAKQRLIRSKAES
jgi:peroxiredoxin